MDFTKSRFELKEWEKATPPFQFAPHSYYVGTAYVGAFLFNTDKGLVLLDQGFAETVYLLFESIRELGFSPKDVKYLLVSHGHFDHCGGTRLVQEYTKAKVYISREDADMMEKHPEWVSLGNPNMIPFKPDCFYSDDSILDFGNVKIETMLTPGHTPGTTSFFIKDDGFVLAMHGGLGFNTLTDKYMDNNPEWPRDIREKYLDSLYRMKDRKVDIPFPSHPGQVPFMEKAGTYKAGKENPFISPENYEKMIIERIERWNRTFNRDK